MQNRNIIWVFTILLALACIYQLSFSVVTSGIESDAAEEASSLAASIPADSTYMSVGNKRILVKNADGTENNEGIATYESAEAEQYLLGKSNEPVYLGFTYKECKQNELAKGLDLEGGMSVALEISIPEMLQNLAGRNAKKNSFVKPYDAAKALYSSKGNDKDFITLFSEKYNELIKDVPMTAIFDLNDEDGNPLGKTASNETVTNRLSEIAVNALDKTKTVIENRIGGASGLNQPSIQKNIASGRLMIDLPGVKDPKSARELLQNTAKLEFWETYKNSEVGFLIYESANKALSDRLFPGYRDSVEKAAADTTLDSNANPADSVQLDSNGIAIEDSNAIDQAKIQPLSYLLAPCYDYEARSWWNISSALGYAKLSDTAKINSYINNEYVQNVLPRELKLMWESKPAVDFMTADNEPLLKLYLVKKTRTGVSALDGDEIKSARQDYDPTSNRPIVTVVFKSAGAAVWADLTKTSYEDQTGIAITMDDKVFSAPVASQMIDGGRTEISGNFTKEEAENLASILQAGSLPAPAKIVDESIVGPTLGAENVKSGLWSFVIALVVVLLYMIFYYAKAGAVADIALIANIFFIFGTLASLGAALTLPGIAGIVLTIGISVDANVLVFERIREELRIGKSSKAAVESGYSKALSAILDANVTTLLTAVVLGYFGSGPIKGFATTLIIGIFTSLFCALVITRLVFSYMLDGKKGVSFSTKMTENVLVKANWKFVARRKVFYVISGLIVIGGVASLATRGLDYGVEFTGGRTYKVLFENEVSYEGLKKTLSDDKYFGEQPEVKMIDNKFKAAITTQFMVDDKTSEASNKVDAALDAGLASFGKYQVIESRQVDPGISNDFKRSSLLAIVFSLLIVFLYIVIRFRKWQFGVGALVAMFHDVLIVLSLFSIFYGILPFSMEIDQAFIAAILTVVGYSINDTVVVFDRLREYLTEKRRDDSKEVINSALNSTLSRTVNTSVTTFIVLLIIFLFGGESIKGMTFALMVGVVVGTYSSLCIATPSVVDLTKTFNFKKKQGL